MGELQQNDLLRQYLTDRDEPCPLCSYNLRGLTSQRCPECGQTLRLRVMLAEPRLASYIALLAACCVSFGGSTLFTVVALKEAPSGWWSQACGLVLLAHWAIAALALPIVLLSHRRFRRLRYATQWTLAALAWIVFLTLSAAFVFLFTG